MNDVKPTWAEIGQMNEEIQTLRAKLERLTKALENLRQYVAVEGYPDGDKLLVGLAYHSHIMGPCADPKFEMYELAEAVEKWLHEKIDAALADN